MERVKRGRSNNRPSWKRGAGGEFKTKAEVSRRKRKKTFEGQRKIKENIKTSSGHRGSSYSPHRSRRPSESNGSSAGRHGRELSNKRRNRSRNAARHEGRRRRDDLNAPIGNGKASSGSTTRVPGVSCAPLSSGSCVGIPAKSSSIGITSSSKKHEESNEPGKKWWEHSGKKNRGREKGWDRFPRNPQSRSDREPGTHTGNTAANGISSDLRTDASSFSFTNFSRDKGLEEGMAASKPRGFSHGYIEEDTGNTSGTVGPHPAHYQPCPSLREYSGNSGIRNDLHKLHETSRVENVFPQSDMPPNENKILSIPTVTEDYPNASMLQSEKWLPNTSKVDWGSNSKNSCLPANRQEFFPPPPPCKDLEAIQGTPGSSTMTSLETECDAMALQTSPWNDKQPAVNEFNMMPFSPGTIHARWGDATAAGWSTKLSRYQADMQSVPPIITRGPAESSSLTQHSSFMQSNMVSRHPSKGPLMWRPSLNRFGQQLTTVGYPNSALDNFNYYEPSALEHQADTQKQPFLVDQMSVSDHLNAELSRDLHSFLELELSRDTRIFEFATHALKATDCFLVSQHIYGLIDRATTPELRRPRILVCKDKSENPKASSENELFSEVSGIRNSHAIQSLIEVLFYAKRTDKPDGPGDVTGDEDYLKKLNIPDDITTTGTLSATLKDMPFDMLGVRESSFSKDLTQQGEEVAKKVVDPIEPSQLFRFQQFVANRRTYLSLNSYPVLNYSCGWVAAYLRKTFLQAYTAKTDLLNLSPLYPFFCSSTEEPEEQVNFTISSDSTNDLEIELLLPPKFSFAMHKNVSLEALMSFQDANDYSSETRITTNVKIEADLALVITEDASKEEE